MIRDDFRVVLKAPVFRKIAAQRNLSLNAFARTLGIGDRYFYRLLGGEVSPSPKKRAVICAVLCLEFDDLFEIHREELNSKVGESTHSG